MLQLANTLYVTTQDAYLRRDHQTLQVQIDGRPALAVPVHHLDGVVCFGRVRLSPGVYTLCKEHALSLSMLTEQGEFLARVQPPIDGQVQLRRAQYRLAENPASCLKLARPILAAKIQNARQTLLRTARDYPTGEAAARLRSAAARMGAILQNLAAAPNLEVARGIEGHAARTYFAAFPDLIRSDDPAFRFHGRRRWPPPDPVNALLSFVYALVRHDCENALQAAGLDPAVGFLHADRPGRASLALDLLEEFRALLADRLVLALLNRRQVRPADFVTHAAGGVALNASARQAVLAAYRQRQRELVRHPRLAQSVPVGLLVHLQARFLARTVRGELSDYPALVLK